MGIVFERELKALLRNIRAVICIALTVFASALFLAVNNLGAGYSGMQSVLSNMSLVAAILIPPVASAVISAERKKGTDAVLDALPVTVWQIILGKFFALLAFFMIPTAIMAIYPIILSYVGGAPMMQGYIMLFAFAVFEAFFIALCLMVSALSSKTWKTILISYGIIAGVFILGLIAPLFNGVLKDILKFVSPFRRFDPTVFDLFDISSLLFYLSFTVLFLYIAFVCYRKKPVLSEKARRIRKRNAVAAAVLAGVILLANIATYMLPSSLRQLDISKEGIYSVSDTTKKYLRDMNDEITVYLLDPLTSEEKLHTFIRRYCESSDKIILKEIYTSEDTDFLKKYGISSAPAYYSIIVESKNTGRWKLVSTDEYFKYYTEGYGDYMSVSAYDEAVNYYTQAYNYYYQNSTGNEEYLESAQSTLYALMYQTSMCIDAESAITTAIEYVSAKYVPTLYFISGHGEKDAEANPLNLSKNGKIPDDAALIVINDPDDDYSASDIAMLQEYSERGGKLIVITDSTINEKTNLVRLLSCFGLSAEELESDSVEAKVNLSSGAFKNMPFDSLALSGASSVITTENENLKFSTLLSVDTEKDGEKAIAVSVSEDSVRKLIWLTGADNFNADTLDMTDTQKEEYLKATYCIQGAVSWLWVPLGSSLEFANPAEYEPAMMIVESGATAFINVIFIGVVPMLMIGAAWINAYVRKKRSMAPRVSE